MSRVAHPDPPGCCVAESSGLPPGPVLGGHPHGRLLLHGAALVRGSHRHLHRPHRQLEDGDRDQRPGGAAPVPGCQVRKAWPCSSSEWGDNPDAAAGSASTASSRFSRHSREQRVTGIIVFVLTGISVFLAPILKVKHPCSLIPVPSLQMFGDLGRKSWIPPQPHSPQQWSPSSGMSCHLPWGKRHLFFHVPSTSPCQCFTVSFCTWALHR